MRGIAILMVLAYHATGTAPIAGNPLVALFISAARTGWVALDLFFVLSGFLIGGILLDAKNSTSYFAPFFARRVVRIIPLYVTWFGIYLALLASGVLVWLPQARVVFDPTIPLWTYAVFVQNFAVARMQSFGPLFLAVTWSLAVEEHFYMTVPAMIRFFNRRAVIWMLSAVVLASPALRLFWKDYPFADTSTPLRLDGLAMGILVAIAMRDRRAWEWFQAHRSPVIVAIFALAAAFAVLVIDHHRSADPGEWAYLHSVAGLLFAAVLIYLVAAPGGLAQRALASPVLRYFGRISFALYLFHLGILWLFHELAFHAPPAVTGPETIAVTTLAYALSVWLADLSWRFLERPMLKWGHERYQFEKQAAATAT